MDESNGEIIDPEELDPETIKAVQRLIRGYSDAAPNVAPTELSKHRAGRHSAFSAILAALTAWLNEIEQESDTGNTGNSTNSVEN